MSDAGTRGAQRMGLRGFGALFGPVWREEGANRFEVRVGTRHLNPRGRLHGAMSMTMQSLAFHCVAAESAAAIRPCGRPQLLSFHCEFVASAREGALVSAFASVTRMTRSLLFLTGQLKEGDNPLMAASAVFRLDGELAQGVETPCVGPPDGSRMPPRYSPVVASEPFTAHVGGVHECYDRRGERFGAVLVDERYLDSLGGVEADAGMLLWLADLFLGRRAAVAAGQPCVTLVMNVTRLAPVRLGNVLEVRSRIDGRTPSVHSIGGSFHVGGTTVMTAYSLWKAIGNGTG